MANKLSSNEISSAGPSGIPRMAPYIGAGLLFLTAVYSTLVFTFRYSPSVAKFLPAAAPEFCNDSTDDVCFRADLFSFQMTSLLAISFCALTGFRCWHVTRRVHTLLPATPAGRLFGYLPEAEQLAAANFTFQLWDFIILPMIPEHCTALMLTHHVAAATVSYCSIRYQYLHYYGVFFLGLSEISSIFLVFVDLAKYFPPLPGTVYDHFVGIVCGPLFVVTFTVYRLLLWWPVSVRLFRDAYAVITSGQAQKLRPACTRVLYVFLGMNLPLGLVQLYWFSLILEEVWKVVGVSW